MLSKVQIETLIELGYNYGTIARMFGVSERTLLRRRVQYDLPIGLTFTSITDNDLDVTVSCMLRVCPHNYCLYCITSRACTYTQLIIFPLGKILKTLRPHAHTWVLQANVSGYTVMQPVENLSGIVNSK